MLRAWIEDISCEGGAGHYRTEGVYCDNVFGTDKCRARGEKLPILYNFFKKLCSLIDTNIQRKFFHVR
jgi:hypothetical protein